MRGDARGRRRPAVLDAVVRWFLEPAPPEAEPPPPERAPVTPEPEPAEPGPQPPAPEPEPAEPAPKPEPIPRAPMSRPAEVLTVPLEWCAAPAPERPRAPRPAEPRPVRRAASVPSRAPVSSAPLRRRVVAVTGVRPRVGSTTLARALAAELAARDPLGCAAVAGVVPPHADRFAPAEGRPGSRGGRLPAGTAARLARALDPAAALAARPAGRLCLLRTDNPGRMAARARSLAPLVLDLSPEQARALADEADHLVLVAPPDCEPALVRAATDALEGNGGAVHVVINRARDARESGPAAAVTAPDSRLGARLARAGRGTWGSLAATARTLADVFDAEAAS